MLSRRAGWSTTAAMLVRFLLGDPLVHAGFQHVQGERAAIQNFVVKRANVELWPQFLLCALAQFQDFQLTELVA
jgi:hypothetical protein